MRGDWMDEARRFEDTDKAILDKLTREPEWVRATIHGHPVWVKAAFLRGEIDDSALAEEGHVVDGELVAFLEISYAHAYRDGIMRYHECIGQPSDIIRVESVDDDEAPQPKQQCPSCHRWSTEDERGAVTGKSHARCNNCGAPMNEDCGS